MEKTLELVFKTEQGSKKTISIADPKDGVTKAETDAAMTTIINADVFETSTGSLAETVEARLRSSEVEVLA